MRRTALLIVSVLSCFLYRAFSQTPVQTSFETGQGYNAGNLHNQNGWTVTSGSAFIYSTIAHTGSQSVHLTAAGTALRVDHVAYSGTVPGITGDVYADMWVNPGSIVTKSFGINGYDLYGGSSKRIFVVEFTIDNKIRAFSGSSSSANIVGTWTANQWVRISIKVDFAAEKYKVAVNGLVYGTELNFRETYTPTASGTRQASIKEYHSLRFNHLTDTDLSTTDISVDDLYVGTSSIPDIAFGGSSDIRTITVNQPDYGSITLNPASGPYVLNQSVTATLTLPQGYMNNGWSGDLSGTALIQNFTVTGNMTIGADVGIDASNPPPKYKITVNAPLNGSIALSPASPDSMYYKETKLTATISYEACYMFNGWTGSISGTQSSNLFTVQNDMTIGADISVNNIPAVKRTVSTVTEFKNALAAMNPGDTLEVNNGSYNLSSLTITRSGCEAKPIVIYAKNSGQVILNGATALILRNMKYVTVKGFLFQSTGIATGVKLENCSHVRITGNSFAYNETGSCTWVYIGDTFASPEPLKSGNNRIDHNIFDGKTQAGNYIRLDGNIDQQTRYDTIDHNWFKNNGPRAANEKESIRVGVSTLSMSSGFTQIEYNLFEDCDGDPEIISVKSCDNTLRYNTFIRCLGTLSLRHGHRSTVEGNYFFGEGKKIGSDGCGGIRVYGKDHKIINNYFHGLTGEKWDAAITITNGDVTNSSTSLSSHFQPENIIVAFNTLVNNYSNIEIGFDNNGNYNKPPINCLIANTIVADSTHPIVKSYSTAALSGVSFNNNIMYPTGTSSIGITATPAQINIIDPLLMQPACNIPASNCNGSNAYKVYRLSPGSPAIDAATGSFPYIVQDFEGQARTGPADIGADEYRGNDPVLISALDSINTGPDAIPFNYGYIYAGALPVRLLNFSVRKIAGAGAIYWQVAEEIGVRQYEVEWSADGRQFATIAVVAAGSANGIQSYHAQHLNLATGRNYYRLKIEDRDGRVNYSPIQMIINDSRQALVIYPNPAKDFVNISISGDWPAETEFKLINAAGMIVKRFKINIPGSQAVSLHGIPGGLYRLQVAARNQPLQSFAIIIL